MPYSIDALAGKVIFVAEDEYMLADAMVAAIQSAGGVVRGPYTTASEALSILRDAERLPDAAALNIRLLDGVSYPVADELRRLEVPFVFASSRETKSVPERFSCARLLSKPYSAHDVVIALGQLLETGA